MTDLKFIGINVPLVLTQRQANPDTDALLMSNYRPSGGASSPFSIEPIAAATAASDNLFILLDGPGGGDVLDITRHATLPKFVGTFTGDWDVTGDLSVGGAATVSGGPSAVNGDIVFGDDALDTVTFARSWIDGTDLSYSSSILLDPGGTPTFGTDGTPHIVVGSGVDPTVNGTDGTYNPPLGSLMMQTDGSLWMKTTAAVNGWSQMATAAGANTSLANTIENAPIANDADVPASARLVFRDQGVTFAGADNLMEIERTTTTGGDGLFVNMNSTGAASTGIEVAASGTGDGISVNHSGSAGNVVDFQDNGTSMFTLGATGAVALTSTSNQNVDITAQGTGDMTLTSDALDMNATGAITMDTTAGGISLDASGSSNFSITAAASETAGDTLTLSSGAGGASAGVAAGGAGAALLGVSGAGGAGDATFAGGVGGAITLTSGNAGADGGGGGALGGDVSLFAGDGTGTFAGGSVVLDAGAGGAATDGIITIGITTAELILIGAEGVGGNPTRVMHEKVDDAGTATFDVVQLSTGRSGVDGSANAGESGAYAIGVDVDLLTNITIAADHYNLMDVLDAFDTAIGAVGGTVDLQSAYDQGSDIVQDNTEQNVSIDRGTNATNEVLALSDVSDLALDVLTINRSPATGGAGEAIDITMGANATGVGVLVDQNGTGAGISVLTDGGGTGVNIVQGTANALGLNIDKNFGALAAAAIDVDAASSANAVEITMNDGAGNAIDITLDPGDNDDAIEITDGVQTLTMDEDSIEYEGGTTAGNYTIRTVDQTTVDVAGDNIVLGTGLGGAYSAVAAGAGGGLTIALGGGGASGSAADAGGTGGALSLTAGGGGAHSAATGVAGAGGALTLFSGDGGTNAATGTGGNAGQVNLQGGSGGSGGAGGIAGAGGTVTVLGGAGAGTGSAGGQGGAVSISGGSGGLASSFGGTVSINAGAGTAGDGNVVIADSNTASIFSGNATDEPTWTHTGSMTLTEASQAEGGVNFAENLTLISTGTGAEAASIFVGDSDPNGNVTSGDRGSLMLDGAAGVLYLKTSVSGASVWTAVQTAASASLDLDTVITAAPIDNAVDIPTGSELAFSDGAVDLTGDLMSITRTGGGTNDTNGLTISMSGSAVGDALSLTDGTITSGINESTWVLDGGSYNWSAVQPAAGTGTQGRAYIMTSGTGSDASGAAGAQGGNTTLIGGIGGASDGTDASASGGGGIVRGGAGGAGSAALTGSQGGPAALAGGVGGAAGTGTAGDGGDAVIDGGSAGAIGAGTGGTGGSVVINPGVGTGAFNDGTVFIASSSGDAIRLGADGSNRPDVTVDAGTFTVRPVESGTTPNAFARQMTLSNNTGNVGDIQIITAEQDPNTVVSAPRGSLVLAEDNTAWINTDGVTAYTQLQTAAAASLDLDTVIASAPFDNDVSIPVANPLIFRDAGTDMTLLTLSTTGTGATQGLLVENASAAGAGILVDVNANNTSSGVDVTQVGSGNAVTVTQTGAGNALTITHTGANTGIRLTDGTDIVDWNGNTISGVSGSDLFFLAGTSTTGTGGVTTIQGGDSSFAGGTGGALILGTGFGLAGSGGAFVASSSDGGASSGNGGNMSLTVGDGFTDTGASPGSGGSLTITSGAGGDAGGAAATGANAGNISITGGDGGDDTGGSGAGGSGADVTITAGAAGASASSGGGGGDVNIFSGLTTAGGAAGNVNINTTAGRGTTNIGNTGDFANVSIVGPTTVRNHGTADVLNTIGAQKTATINYTEHILLSERFSSMTEISIITVDGSPDTLVTAERGSFALGTTGLAYINTSAGATGTDWDQVITGSAANFAQNLDNVITTAGGGTVDNTVSIPAGNELDFTDGGTAGALMTLQKTAGGASALVILQTGTASGNALDITHLPTETGIGMSDGTNISNRTATQWAGVNGASLSVLAGPTAVGDGGDVTIQGGLSSAASAEGGDIIITAGPGIGATSDGGDVIIDGGTGTSTNGTISIGSTNALSVAIGSATGPTTMFHAEVSGSAGNASNVLNAGRTVGGTGSTAVAVGSYTIGVNAQTLTNINGLNAITNPDLQETLESIDAAIGTIGATAPTLQDAYDNDVNGSDALITTNAIDGSVVIAGTEDFHITATGGLNVDTIADFDVSAFDVQMSGTNGFSIDGTAASNMSVDAGALTLSTTTSGNVVVASVADVDINGVNILADATAGISLDAAAASNFSVDGANLTLATTTSGSLIGTSAGLMDLNAGANLDIDVTGSFDMLSTGAFSIDGTGASNVTATSGALTLSTATSGNVIVSSAADIDADAANIIMDATAGVSIDAAAASNFTVAGAFDLTLGAHSALIELNETDFTISGVNVPGPDFDTSFTADSIIGAINELRSGLGGAVALTTVLTVAAANTIEANGAVAIDGSGDAVEGTGSTAAGSVIVGFNVGAAVTATNDVTIGSTGYMTLRAAGTINEGDYLILTADLVATPGTVTTTCRVIRDTDTSHASYPDSDATGTDHLVYVGRAIEPATVGNTFLAMVEIERPIAL